MRARRIDLNLLVFINRRPFLVCNLGCFDLGGVYKGEGASFLENLGVLHWDAVFCYFEHYF
jgi:hypothetical protein